ncbi:hypothetical protein BDR26DRAFT_868569 [Obelidium mucronatum]|nr:hypothetical protein BDR26DRAFT_868569 [Obelidium mucronatum]
MQQSLHAWLRVLVDDPSASRAFYEQKAIMRDKLAMDKIIKAIEVDVSPLEFHFVFKRDGSSPATSPLGQTVLPNPAPLVHALSHAATTNASILASSAFEIGKGAFGFGLQTFAAAKESLDSEMVTLNLNSKRSILDMKSSAAQIDTAPPPPPIGYNRQSVSASGGAPPVGVLGVTNVPREDIDSPTEMGIAPDLLIFQLKQELEDTRKTVNDEREARRQLQADFLNLKHSKDREVASLRNEISLLQKQLILAKKPFHDINDI